MREGLTPFLMNDSIPRFLQTAEEQGAVPELERPGHQAPPAEQAVPSHHQSSCLLPKPLRAGPAVPGGRAPVETPAALNHIPGPAAA